MVNFNCKIKPKFVYKNLNNGLLLNYKSNNVSQLNEFFNLVRFCLSINTVDTHFPGRTVSTELVEVVFALKPTKPQEI